MKFIALAFTLIAFTATLRAQSLEESYSEIEQYGIYTVEIDDDYNLENLAKRFAEVAVPCIEELFQFKKKRGDSWEGKFKYTHIKLTEDVGHFGYEYGFGETQLQMNLNSDQATADNCYNVFIGRI